MHQSRIFSIQSRYTLFHRSGIKRIRPSFTAAAAGPSADQAVIEGSIMLARTVVALAESPAERDRVLALKADRA